MGHDEKRIYLVPKIYDAILGIGRMYRLGEDNIICIEGKKLNKKKIFYFFQI